MTTPDSSYNRRGKGEQVTSAHPRAAVIHSRRPAYPALTSTTPYFVVCSSRLRAVHDGRKIRQRRSLADYRQAVERRGFPIPLKPYHNVTHGPSPISLCYRPIISCTPVRRVCILPTPLSPPWIGQFRPPDLPANRLPLGIHAARHAAPVFRPQHQCLGAPTAPTVLQPVPSVSRYSDVQAIG